MGKSLIITEKPSVARDFAAVLKVSGRGDGFIENKEYVITWCVGHLVGMVYPESYDPKYKKWRLEDLPFLPEEYKYDVIQEVGKQYGIVHRMLMREDVDRVYWAGDAGKEGQTIEENIRNFGGVRPGMEELRVWIDSQTEEEILRGIREAKPMSEYAHLGESGIMRTIEDYAMGINFSRAMSVKYGNLLNQAAGTKSYTAIAVGRVMTCVLGMVVRREREIRDFKETPFYRVIGSFTEHGVDAEWKAVEGSKYYESPLLYKENGFKNEEDAAALMKELEGKSALVDRIEKNISRKRPPLLFNLAELQAECSKKFKISPDQTLQIAQALYEKKLTTYPRTDARVLSSAVAREISRNISKLKNYAPTEGFVHEIMEKKLYSNIGKSHYTDDSKVTDHYAIIPTGQLTELDSLNSLQRRVFEMIVRRFLSIFYPAAEYRTVKLTIDVEGEKFFTSAKILEKPGYLAVAVPPKPKEFEEENSRILGGRKLSKENEESSDRNEDSVKVDPQMLLELSGKLKKGDPVEVNGYSIKQGKTSPPKRYTSGSMVLAMENAGQLIEDEELREQIRGSGIGTSATRAEIIEKLVRIHYLNLNKKTQILTPENLGEMVYEVVNLTVPQLLEPKMTASWEKGLDGITQGTVEFWDYRRKLEDFIRKETEKMIHQDLRQFLGERIAAFSGKNVQSAGIRKRIGVKCPACGEGEITTTPFGYGCSRYKNDKSGCNFSIGSIAGVELSEEQVCELIEKGQTGTIRGFKSKAGKRFDARLILEKNGEKGPSVKFDFTELEPEFLPDVVCPACGGRIQKTSFGYGCVNYNREDPSSCRFSIGKIAGKSLSQATVKRLLTEKRTETIRGFKSRSGKRFDACLVLKTNEEKKPVIEFDFENVESKKLTGVVCPLCGGKISVTSFGYGCDNYDKNDPESCRFFVGTIAGVKLKESQVKELLKKKKTSSIEGFVAKTGMMFSAALKLTDEGRVVFDFPEPPKPVPSKLRCPKCGEQLYRGQWRYECKCGFNLQHTVAKVELSEEVIGELLTKGRTAEKVSGFTSKAGNVFDAVLKLEDDAIKFDFSARPVSGQKGIEKNDTGQRDETPGNIWEIWEKAVPGKKKKEDDNE